MQTSSAEYFTSTLDCDKIFNEEFFDAQHLVSEVPNSKTFDEVGKCRCTSDQ